MLDPKNVNLKIKPDAEKIIMGKVKPGQIRILALNDGSNGYSKLGGTCTIGANFQLVVLEKKDPEFSIPVKNNLNLEMYTSPDELSFLDAGLVLNARNSVLALSDNEGIVDGAVTIEEFSGKKLSKEEMEKLGGKIC